MQILKEKMAEVGEQPARKTGPDFQNKNALIVNRIDSKSNRAKQIARR